MKRLHISLGGQRFETEASRTDATLEVSLRAPGVDAKRRVQILRAGPNALLLIGDRLVSLHAGARSTGNQRSFVASGAARHASLGVAGASGALGTDSVATRALSAPMPGRIVQVTARAGEPVEKGQLLLVIEAMKMQNELYSPVSGRIRAVLVHAGDTVERGALLLEFE